MAIAFKTLIRKSLFILFLADTFAQEIPKQFKEYKIQEFLIDAGQGWKLNTTLGSVRFHDLNKEKNNLHNDSLYVKTRFGSKVKNKSIALYPFSHFIYQKYFYGYLYSRIVNDTRGFENFSGIKRDISRLGFISGETDLSGIGFQNNWLFFQIGRGREVWGAGDNIQLALGNSSPSYDYFMYGSDYGKLKVKYIHGFLEASATGINRYITARGLEWSNKSSLVFSISEMVVYSGLNRPMDFGYMNPLSTHLEIELNERLNYNGYEEDGSANGTWQISFDKIFRDKLRFSSNLLIDEFILDISEYKSGKQNGYAYSGRISYILPNKKDNKSLTSLFLSTVKIGKSTFRHSDGMNNFVIRNKPIGYIHGNSLNDIKLGVNFFNAKNLIIKFAIGYHELSENSLAFTPYARYEDYTFSSNLSEKIIINRFSEFFLEYWLKENFSLSCLINLDNLNYYHPDISYNVGLDIFLPMKFTI